MTPDEREYWEERAAIREFHGGQSREEAEKGAWEDFYRWRGGSAEAVGRLTGAVHGHQQDLFQAGHEA